MKGKVPLLIIAGLIVLFVLMVALQPRPLDWRRDYRHNVNKPFAAEIFAEMLPQWLGDMDGAAEIQHITIPPFEHLADTTLSRSLYFFLNDGITIDEAESNRLLAFASRGNTVFIASETLSGPLADSLGVPRDTIETTADIPGLDYLYDWDAASNDSLLILTASNLAREEGYHTPFTVGNWTIDGLDKERTMVLGTSSNGHPNLVRIAVGQGEFLLSAEPLVFTNAALTGDGDVSEYLAGVLGYVSAETVFWDAYYKPIQPRANTPLRTVGENPPLSFGLFLIIIGSLLFIVFRGRRWQRPVPVITPPANAAVDFVRTVGRLYFQHGDHRALINKKLRYFFDRIQTRLSLRDLDLSQETELRVLRRSGAPETLVATIFARFRRLTKQREFRQEDILALDRALDSFYETIDH